MIAVNVEQLGELFPRAKDDVLRAVARNADDTLSHYGINETLDRLSFFFAQVGHESAGLTRLEESFSYSDAARLYRYYRRKGHFDSVAEAVPFVRNPDGLRQRLYGDGPGYYGRGLIQLTNRENYQAVGEIVGLPLVSNPELAADPEHVLLIACGYWKWRGINLCADQGDYDAASRRINPKEPYLAARRTYLDAARRIFSGRPDLPPLNPRPPIQIPEAGDLAMLAFGASGALVESLQRTLKRLNYPVGDVDGLYGGVTRDAVQSFQANNNLLVTGEVDAQTWAQLQHASARPFSVNRTDATAKDLRAKGSRTIAGADNVKLSGLAAVILGVIGLISRAAGLSADPGSSGTVQPATADLTAATEKLAAVVKSVNLTARQFPTSFDTVGPTLMTALNEWLVALQKCGQFACVVAKAAPNAGGWDIDHAFGPAGDALLPIVSALVPGGVAGSAILAALGVAVRVFGNRIIDARVDDHRKGQNLDR